MVSARTFLKLCACWALLGTVGCATLNLTNIDLRSRKATARNPVVRIVCLWEPAEGRDPKGVPCQGFAGQILFLNAKSLPVTVDGDVRIYLFDNQGTAEEQAKPLHQFDFDTGAWKQHYSYGTLGPAYNVFVPYTRRGTSEATCDLRLRFTPAAGPVIFSDMTSIEVLGFSGAKTSSKEAATERDPRVEETTPEDHTASDRRRKTTTIVLNGQRTPDPATLERESSSDNPIQLASHQTEDGIRPLTAEDARIAQLEQMLAELQAQAKKDRARLQPAVEAVPAAPVPAAPPQRLPEPELLEEESRVRIKPRSAPRVTSNRTSTSTEPARAPHPLDDDAEPRRARRSANPQRHPLLDATESHPALEPGDASSEAFRPQPRPARRSAHILEETDDPFAPIPIESR